MQICEVIWIQEEHILRLIQMFEAGCVIRELITQISCGGVAKQDALDLSRELSGQFWVVAHDIAVAGVCDKEELALGEGFEDFFKQELSN